MKNYYMVSISHIDMAFVHRREAHAEMVEILLERMIQVLERNPEICFGLEQAAHYRNLKERRPDLFQKVKELIREGRLEFMGGMATTAETNFPNGECFVRNQGMGLLWLEENFGTKPYAGWLVDTFGMNPQIPQIMEQFGFRHLHANRFGGDKRCDLFEAEGLNGSRVLIIGCDSASVNVQPDTQSFIFCRSWHDVDVMFQKADKLKGELPKLITYYIENEEVFSEYYLKIVEERRKKGENWIHATHRQFVEALESSDYRPPVIKDDLNPEFTGTYALRTPLKTGNRRAENALLNAERWDALLTEEKNECLENNWWDLFHCQFHDAFTGSHEDITTRDMLNKYEKICRTSKEALRSALKIEETPDSIVCVNHLPWKREEWVELTTESAVEVFDEDLKIPMCRRDGKLFFLAKLEAGSIKQYQIRGGGTEPENNTLSGREIRNEWFRLVLDEREGIQTLEDSEGNCYIKNAGNFLVAEEDRGGMQIEACDGNELYAVTGDVQVEAPVSDAMGEHISMTGNFPVMGWNRNNRLSWKAEFSLVKGEKALRLKLVLDWVGDRTRIRLRLPFEGNGRDVYHEVPFGVKRRDAYRNRPTAKGEWPVQRFAAMEDGSRGIALMNKGIAGVEQEGSMLATTLIRAYGNGPDAWVSPTEMSSQHGKQTFEFIIMPYSGSWKDANVVETAHRFNSSVDVFPGRRTGLRKEEQFFALQGNGLVLSCIKKAWDDSGELIVRIYETKGQKAEGSLFIRGIQNAWSSDLPERKNEQIAIKGGDIKLNLEPYEIQTVRIKV